MASTPAITDLISARSSTAHAGRAVSLTIQGEQLRALYRVTEAMELLSLSRSVIYELIRSGRLRSVCEGRARRISASAIADYVSLLEREQAPANRRAA